MINFGNSGYADISISKKVYTLILIFSFAWILSIIAAPIFMNLGGVFKIPGEFLYLFFSKTCHQFDSRSFHFLEHSFAVCSRCFTIYLGFLTGIIIYPFKYKINNTSVPPLFMLFLFLLPLVSDVLLDMSGILPNTFITRSITGFIAGVVLPFYLIPGAVRFFSEVISYLRNRTINLN